MTMSRAGEVYLSPPTRERVVVRIGTAETGGELLALDVYVRPGGAVVGEHVHPLMEESFVLIHGQVGVRVNGEESVYDRPGERVRVPAGTPHFWWNAGDGEARMLVQVRPRAVRFEQMVLRQLYGLARDGKTDAGGRPGLLQAAVIAQAYGDVTRFTEPSPAVQRVLYGTLAPLARVLGYRALDPAYEGEAPMTDIEPLPPGLENLLYELSN